MRGELTTSVQFGGREGERSLSTRPVAGWDDVRVVQSRHNGCLGGGAGQNSSVPGGH